MTAAQHIGCLRKVLLLAFVNVVAVIKFVVAGIGQGLDKDGT